LQAHEGDVVSRGAEVEIEQVTSATGEARELIGETAQALS
jgi:hypothetical protein